MCAASQKQIYVIKVGLNNQNLITASIVFVTTSLKTNILKEIHEHVPVLIAAVSVE